MLAVQPVRGSERHEELRSARIRPGVRHRKDSLRVVRQLRVELIGNRVARSASSRAVGAAALQHESCNHTVEDDFIVVTLLDKVDEVLRCRGGPALEEFDLEVAEVGREVCESVCHGHPLG